MASFTAPYMFDTDRRYLTTAILNARTDDPAAASALAIVLAGDLAPVRPRCSSALARRPSPPRSKGSAAAPLPVPRRVVIAQARGRGDPRRGDPPPDRDARPALVQAGGTHRGGRHCFENLTDRRTTARCSGDQLGRPIRARAASSCRRSDARSLYAAVATVANVAFALAPRRRRAEGLAAARSARSLIALDAPASRSRERCSRSRSSRRSRRPGRSGSGRAHRPIAR